MPTHELPIGTHGEFVRTVEEQHTLVVFLDWLPPVLTTPWMIAWLEGACFVAAAPFCAEGETTVGTAIHVTHTAPTAVGEEVRCEAMLDRVEGKFYIYRVSARTAKGLIGEGEIHRAFVDVTRFKAKLKA